MIRFLRTPRLSTRRQAATGRRSLCGRTTRLPATISDKCCTPRGTGRGPPPATRRPSNSTPNSPTPTSTWVACLHAGEPARRRRLLPEGHRTRPQKCRGPQQPRQRAADQGRLDGAVAEFREGYRTRPQTRPGPPRPRHHLARQRGSGQCRRVCFRKAIELDPKNAPAHSDLGLVLLDQGGPGWRHGLLSEGHRTRPQVRTAHNNLGLVLRDQGRLDEAITEFREAVRLDPNAGWTHDQLGWTLRLQGKLAEALTRCKKAVELQPREANFHNSLGYVLWDQDKLDEAIAEFREAVRLDSHFAAAAANLADAERMLPCKRASSSPGRATNCTRWPSCATAKSFSSPAPGCTQTPSPTTRSWPTT